MEKLIQQILNLHEEDIFHTESNGNKLWYGTEVINSRGETLEWEDFLTIDIPLTLLKLTNDEVMYCDYILYFGDGTIEFHDADYLDAVNWCEFTNESIEKITDILISKTK